jgi:hypothetical protein
MSIVPLSTESTAIQHSVGAGNNLSGDQPNNGAPAFDQARHVLVHPEEAAGGGGYFRPEDSLEVGDNHAYCTHVQIFSQAAFTWTLNVTSGFGDGTGLDGDDPVHDQTIATGSVSSHVRVNIELLPGQAIRVSTAGASTPVYAIAHFAETSGDHGRLIS